MTFESLFDEVFLPLYPADAKGDLFRARTLDVNPEKNETLFFHLRDAAATFVAMAPAIVELDLDYSDASIHRLGVALTDERRDAWIARGAKGTDQNELFNVVIHGAAYVGECIVSNHRAAWSVRRPLWESVVILESHVGVAHLHPFLWLLRSLSSQPGLAERYRMYVEEPTRAVDAMPILIGDERKLPRLRAPRYALFHQYLRAHLPEVDDLGENFPSPERFDAYAFRWLDFHVVGGGRMVLAAGAGEGGLHMFWIGAEGFDKSAYLLCDAFPDPIVTVKERITITRSVSGKVTSEEMMWWGP